MGLSESKSLIDEEAAVGGGGGTLILKKTAGLPQLARERHLCGKKKLGNYS